ncbi:hypothetical protein FC52_GL001085 [Lactobacillus pasteurii DSM 23907 = CRBIP 24.76]|uniref:hypothetical protein n=1 Tax=Lactobacillus pasteurii TaxID=872327 RepID=UPI0006EE5F69|nr:hypothetical protein [Lactobacillus pasteurii]KRK07173.1 hypothetical protein FC52_GL001085 [Lactobacillus pasteurii DSM 23907 = CRBIP 24.76]TDG75225.1 hypothetical protein C5L33_000293 [Lactobacillus pasteurii]
MSHEAKYVPPKKYPFTEDKIFGWVMENQEFCLYLLQIILPDTYIIFLCSEDPSRAFNKPDNKAVHFFKTIDAKDSDLKLNDGSTKVIINSKGDFAGESEELKELAKLMNDEEVSLNEHFIWAQERIKELNRDRRSDIMRYEANLMAQKIQGREEGEIKGRIIGRAEGKAEGRAEGLTNLIIILGESDFSDEQIFAKVKSRYGKYFTDEQIKQFMDEAKLDV